MTSSARPSRAIRSRCGCSEMSSRKARWIRKVRPASVTSASPRVSISGRALSIRCATCPGSLGAPMVATARDLRDRPGRRDDGGAAERVPDEERRRDQVLAQVVGGPDQVRHVGAERGVPEVPARLPQPGEVEAQDGDTVPGQAVGDAGGGEPVLAAGEAVREDGVCPRLAFRQVEPGRQRLATGPGELQLRRARHAPLLGRLGRPTLRGCSDGSGGHPVPPAQCQWLRSRPSHCPSRSLWGR